MNNPTWCTQFSDQECIDGHCCLDDKIQLNENITKGINNNNMVNLKDYKHEK